MQEKKIFLIAEIGINHNGDINIAKKLIDLASEAGFDAVKFQKRTVNKVYSEKYLKLYRESPWGNTQKAQKEGLELGESEYQEIDKYCKAKKIIWFASSWDLDSQIFLRKFDLKLNKIASPMLGNLPLIKMVADEKKKTFISTGMSSLEEIDKVVNIFLQKNCPFELMHCNSTYPLPDDEANISCILTLKERYNCEVGYSGHESSLIVVSTIATALGATSIERHITLDRTMYGTDQAASIQANSLKNFVSTIRKVHKILGDGRKKISDKEMTARKKLRVDIK